jgi:hypothetical protein
MKRKNYNKENEKLVKDRDSIHYFNNRQTKIRQSKKRNISPVKFSSTKTRDKIASYEYVRKSNSNNIECKCAYCGEWFEPTKQQINNRLRAIYGEAGKGSEMRLYCSQQCKDNCPIYNQKLYSKDFKPATSREVQPQLRQLVFERDNYTCQRCG